MQVSLLSRIHHRNLVAFLGYCQEEGKNILVYEFMHNGTLKEHLYGMLHQLFASEVVSNFRLLVILLFFVTGPLIQERTISWIKRLEVAEDAAKGSCNSSSPVFWEGLLPFISPLQSDYLDFFNIAGIEYLHTGCIPAIIHRDLKSSNILLDKHMRAKVSDFGLSKLAVEGSTYVSSVVRGTVGYLDPE